MKLSVSIEESISLFKSASPLIHMYKILQESYYGRMRINFSSHLYGIKRILYDVHYILYLYV